MCFNLTKKMRHYLPDPIIFRMFKVGIIIKGKNSSALFGMFLESKLYFIAVLF